MDLSRRRFLQVGTLSAMTAFSGTAAAQQIQTDSEGYQSVSYYIGPQSERPTPAEITDVGPNATRVYYGYIYEDENGSKSYITQDMDEWQPLNYIQQVNVFDASDLPEPTNGTHTLDAQTAYFFYGFVDSPYGLDVSNGPTLIGRHASLDGFIHTGQNTAIVGTGGALFLDHLYIHAPGGTIFDVSGDQTTEMYIDTCAFSDAAGLGQIASLGVMDGFRVPTIKACNFEHFASGLTFDGSPNKIFIEGSPTRNVSAAGVTIFDTTASFEVDIVDVVNNYYKNLQSDTVIWRVDPSATITEIFQYRGNTHDLSVTKSNILAGQLGLREVGTIVAESFPLRNTDVSGSLSLNSTYTILDGGPGIVAGDTTLFNAERLSSSSAGVIQYDGTRDNQTRVSANLSISAANTRVAARLLRNGTPVDRTETTIDTTGSGSRDNLTVIAGSLLLTTGDLVSVQLEDTDGTADIEVGRMDLAI